MKKLITLLCSGVLLSSLNAQNARLQAIHNSADAATSTVDVYLTTPSGSSLLLNDFSFRNASPFINAPAGVDITLGFAGSNSSSVNDTIPGLSYTYNLSSGSTYIVVAEGIVSATGYSPATPFGISVYAMGRESSNLAGNTDILVHHGSTDAPTVDVDEVIAGNLVNNASYGDFAGYLELPTADYQLQVKDASGTNVVASYDAPLSTLSLDGEAITVIASGFLDPANNSNGPAFGLYVALPAGGALVALPSFNPTARLQAIHNSADAATSTVDVYLTTSTGSSLLLDNFSFRNASPFINAPAEEDITIGFAASNSTSINDTIPGLSYTYRLSTGSTYILVAEGIVSASGYSPATPFGISVYTMGRESSTTTGNTDILVHHGSTDAPIVDIDEVTAGNLVDNAAYGDFAGYLELPTADYQLQVKNAAGTTVVASFDAPLATLNLDDNAITVIASGFLNPVNNSNGAAFGLYAALPTGGALVALPASSTTGFNEQELNENTLNIYPNPVKDQFNIEGVNLNNVNISIIDLAGKQIESSLYRVNGSSINVSNLSRGSYIIIFSEENKTLRQSKFIKF